MNDTVKLSLFSSTNTYAQQTTTVVRVVDGDTLKIRYWGKEESIRLIGTIHSLDWWYLVLLVTLPILHTQKTAKAFLGFMVLWLCCSIQLLKFTYQMNIGLL